MKRTTSGTLVIATSLAAPALFGCGARSGPFEWQGESVAGEDAGADAGSRPPESDAGRRDSGATGDASTCNVARARVFVTTRLFGANFGGVSGADADCMASARSGGVGGTWRAWLSDSRTPASAHIDHAPGGYVLLDGTVVAKSFGALLSGTLAHAIDLTEARGPITDGNTEVWTGIDVRGGGGGGFCADGAGRDWSSADARAPTPFVGHEDATDATWTAAYLQFCNRTNVRLYCFEACD